MFIYKRKKERNTFFDSVSHQAGSPLLLNDGFTEYEKEKNQI